tara:strand:+ start:95 stop:379 length:285 start_codon:yes stop_codon:yes gene_type:complete
MNHFELERHLISDLSFMQDKLELLKSAINSPDMDSFFDKAGNGVNHRRKIVENSNTAISYLKIIQDIWLTASNSEREKLLERFNSLSEIANVST